MSMRKKVIADNVIKLLKKGYSPKEITERMAVSYNYAWKLKKDLEKAAGELKTTILKVDKNVFPEAGEFVQADTNVDAILNARATTYGSFADVAEIVQRIKHVISSSPNWDVLPSDTKEMLDMIATKVGRILSGDPEYVDNVVDIIGYAQLVLDRMNGKTERGISN